MAAATEPGRRGKAGRRDGDLGVLLLLVMGIGQDRSLSGCFHECLISDATRLWLLGHSGAPPILCRTEVVHMLWDEECAFLVQHLAQ